MSDRVQLRFALGVLAALAVVALGACSIDEGANPAFGCEGCPADDCMMGFCLSRDGLGHAGNGADAGDAGDGGNLTGDGGGVAGTGGGAGDGGTTPPPPEDCDEPGKTEFCYEGPGDTATSGSCKAGMRVCGQSVWGPCLGQVLPGDEQCNREDDDCDGEVDEDLALGTCSTGQDGVCEEGTLLCENGIAVCGRATDPGAEVCNGHDDDCDGEIDEELSPLCYPAAPSGCMDDGQGGFICMGLCVPGVARCVDGQPQACDGQIEPATEECGSGGPAAQDEDCDGQADNGCTCSGSDSQSCYDGPIETLDVGICHAGTQQCEGTTYGPCMDEQLPGVESCANEGDDDDCNDTIDDVRGRGEPCTIDDAKGVCSDGTQQCKDGELTCVGPGPSDETCNMLDDDCDGSTDEGLLGTDQHCSACDAPCSSDSDPSGGVNGGPNCCSAECVNILTDPLNCGRCGNRCGQGLSCCSGECTNTQTDVMNCGGCGQPCDGLNGCCQEGKCTGLVQICL